MWLKGEIMKIWSRKESNWERNLVAGIRKVGLINLGKSEGSIQENHETAFEWGDGKDETKVYKDDVAHRRFCSDGNWLFE